MHDDHVIVERRIRHVLDRWIRPAVWSPGVPLEVTARHLPGEPVPYAEATAGTFEPFAVGQAWGTPWSTTWFRMRGRVPDAWDGRRVEARIEFSPRGNPGFAAEALVWIDGEPHQGLAPYHRTVTVGAPATGGAEVDLWVEAAANPDLSGGFEPTPMGDPATAPATPLYRLGRAELAVRHDEVYALWMDWVVLSDLMADLGTDDPRRHEIRWALLEASRRLDPHRVPDTAGAARAELAGVLSRPARASAHRIRAGGHAHIDTAWLWPMRETRRKCARTFATAVTLAAEHPEHLFVCSQAQQWDWIRTDHPGLFERMRTLAGEGRFVPVGSMWVEADCNLPSGESLVRQLTEGKRWFAEHLGVETVDVWLPDVFGYPASLPTIIAAAGCRWFLTQKISWNQQNTFPHHTFWWEGLDGTRVFTHFPPADTYNGTFRPSELRRAERRYAEAGRGRTSYYPFGLGDGGGGPTREMLELARRQRDLDGVPTVELCPPDRFFAEASAELADAAVWRGELYLEMHRGTYSTQARTKQGNLACELALREAELWSATAGTWPAAELRDLWRTVLTHQFHDILPGSSIRWVHAETEAVHARVLEDLEVLVTTALDRLTGGADTGGLWLANAAPVPFSGVVEIDGARWDPADVPHQRLSDGRVAVAAAVPPFGLAPPAGEPPGEVTVRVEGDRTVLDNGLLVATIGADGHLVSLLDRTADREALAGPANQLHVHRDHPNQYPAWDVEHMDLAAPVTLGDLRSITVTDHGPLVAAVEIVRHLGSADHEPSVFRQRYVLRAGARRLDIVTEVDWRHRDTLVKVAFPLDVRSDRLTCAIQHGHVDRPTHRNTSWDAAKFEVCAHRWVDLAEHGYGVAVLNDGRWGHDVIDGSTVRVTLVRGPRFPDPDADRGHHRVTLSVMPHPGDRWAVVSESWALTAPPRPTGAGARPPEPLIAVEGTGLVVTAVKRADDGSGDLIVRGHEALGGRCRVRLGGPAVAAARTVTRTDLLERPVAGPEVVTGGRLPVELRPFELVTLRLAGDPPATVPTGA